MSRTLSLVRVLLASLVLAPTVSRAGDFQPLAIGNRWEYRGTAGSHQVETISGQTVVHGRVVAVKSYSEGPDAGLQNYWLLAPDGSVLLAGFLNPSAALAVAYEPPIRYLPVPPVVSPGPFQPIVVHDLFTDAVIFTGDLRFDVTEEVTLSLPAGSFHSFGVGRAIPLPITSLSKGASFTLDGRRLPASDPSIYLINTTDWYSEGVGDVQYKTGDLYQLVGFGQPTATASSSWSALKRLYR
jgi:hypothetical protein